MAMRCQVEGEMSKGVKMTMCWRIPRYLPAEGKKEGKGRNQRGRDRKKEKGSLLGTERAD
jgi:hypothetical protein